MVWHFALKATLSIFYGQQIPTGVFLPCQRKKKKKKKISLLADVGEIRLIFIGLLADVGENGSILAIYITIVLKKKSLFLGMWGKK